MNLRELLEAARENEGDFTGFAVFDGNMISFGMESSRERPLVVFVREEKPGWYRLDDGGESWSGLAAAGYADPAPTSAEVARLERLCAMYALKWDAPAREVYGLCEAPTILEVGRRITAVSLAIDGWKALVVPIEPRLQRVANVVDQLGKVAPPRGWAVEPRVVVSGRVHQWRMPARLIRSVHEVAIDFSLDRDTEHILRDAVAWRLDRQDRPRVLVLRETVVAHLRGASELGKLTRLVARATSGTEDRVVDAAEDLAAA
jgi:hypothetical protein